MLITLMPHHIILSIRRGQTGAHSRNAGFTLVELLIALLLGVLVIGGIATVFLSSQQTYLRLSEYNNAQEAFRYATHTITRLTRGASTVAPSGNNNLVLELGQDESGTNRNCLGEVVADPEFNRISVLGNNLICEVSFDGSAWADAEILVRNVDTLDITYATEDRRTYQSTYLNAGTVDASDDWGNVRGFRITLGMTEGYQVTFTSSVRALLLPPDVIVRPSG